MSLAEKFIRYRRSFVGRIAIGTMLGRITMLIFIQIFLHRRVWCVLGVCMKFGLKRVTAILIPIR